MPNYTLFSSNRPKKGVKKNPYFRENQAKLSEFNFLKNI
jgi:hypothetical protein